MNVVKQILKRKNVNADRSIRFINIKPHVINNAACNVDFKRNGILKCLFNISNIFE
jgi:hypothetical protein